MDESKPWYLSKTVIASVVVVVIGVLGAFGVAVDGLRTEQDNLVEVIIQLASALAGAVAVYGRLTAKAKIRGKDDL